MDALHEAEARKGAWLRAVLVQVDFPGAIGTIGWCDGGWLSWDSGDGSVSFKQFQPDWGAFDRIEGLGSATESATTSPELVLLPVDDVAFAALSSPLNQGSRIRVWYVARDRDTGALIGAPNLRFIGRLNQPKAAFGQSWNLRWTCTTGAARQKLPNTNWRLNHGLQARIWSGDLGLLNTVKVKDQVDRVREWRS